MTSTIITGIARTDRWSRIARSRAPKGECEDVIAGWLETFSSAPNPLPWMTAADEATVEHFNQWLRKTHRLLSRLQVRFKFTHRVDSEVLPHLL